MLVLNLYVNRDQGTLFSGLQNSQPVLPQSLPLYFGDTLTINLYTFTAIQASINPAGNFGYQLVPVAGLAPLLYITNGTIAGGAAPYASCVQWDPDPTGTYVTGTLALTSPELLAAFGNSQTFSSRLIIGFVQNAVPVSIFNSPVILGVGVQNYIPALPPQLTPLSVQAASLMFMPIQPIPGQPLYLATESGKVTAIEAIDDGGPGHIEMNPINQVV